VLKVLDIAESLPEYVVFDDGGEGVGVMGVYSAKKNIY
jgi:hypothetical protein